MRVTCAMSFHRATKSKAERGDGWSAAHRSSWAARGGSARPRSLSSSPILSTAAGSRACHSGTKVRDTARSSCDAGSTAEEGAACAIAEQSDASSTGTCGRSPARTRAAAASGAAAAPGAAPGAAPAVVAAAWCVSRRLERADCKDWLTAAIGASHAPPSVTVDWDAEALAALPARGACVLKAALGSRGDAVSYVASARQALAVVRAHAARARAAPGFLAKLAADHGGRVPGWVVQRFVASPRVFGGARFHLRAHVVVLEPPPDDATAVPEPPPDDATAVPEPPPDDATAVPAPREPELFVYDEHELRTEAYAGDARDEPPFAVRDDGEGEGEGGGGDDGGDPNAAGGAVPHNRGRDRAETRRARFENATARSLRGRGRS